MCAVAQARAGTGEVRKDSSAMAALEGEGSSKAKQEWSRSQLDAERTMLQTC